VRKLGRTPWAALWGTAVTIAAMVPGRPLSLYRVVVLAAMLATLIVAAIVYAARRARRGEEPLGAVLVRRRQRARARLRSAAQLHAEAPVAAGFAALFSFPAVILALVATPSQARAVYLPPVADARWQLWCIAIALVAGVVAVDCWLGLGTCARAVATDGFSAGLIGLTVTLAAMPPLMIFWSVESRPAWLGLIAVQFCWPFAGVFWGHAVTARRKRPLSPPAPGRASASWLGGYGIDAHLDVVLISPGARKIAVIKVVRILTGMGLREAKDLVDNAPGLVMSRATDGQAGRAKELLERAGATVIAITSATAAADGTRTAEADRYSS
jgi:large subunit ribosomal protein L7/L12